MSDSAERPPLCASAPLLWSLLPMVAGILSTQIAEAFFYTLLAMAIIACAFLRIPYRLPILLSCAAGGLLTLNSANNPHTLYDSLPPRESYLTLRIEEMFNARKPGRIAGIGKILQTDIPHDVVTGSKAAFYCRLEDDNATPAGLGDVIRCRFLLTYLPHLKEQDDYQMYLLRRDIFLTLNRGRVLERIQPASAIEMHRRKLSHGSQAILSTGCDEPEDPGHVLASMLLGNRSLLTDERIELYRRTGTYHLFAVSGLHVGSVALCLHLLGGLLRLPAIWRLLPILIVTWGYVWLTGASPSAVRAGIMITCIGAARHLLRQPHLFPALTLSAWIVLLLDPRQLFQLGFQLSYGVVASIILVGLPLARHFRILLGHRFAERFPLSRWKRGLHSCILGTSDLVSVSLSASIGSMPLIVQHFSLFTPGGVFFGMLLNPLATLTVMAGCLSLLTGPFPLPLAGLIARATWPLIELMEMILETCLRIPGAVATRNWPWPPSGTCLLLATLILAWVFQRLRQNGRILHPASLFVPHLIILAGLAFTSLQT